MDLRKIEDVREERVNTGGEGNVREEKNTKGELLYLIMSKRQEERETLKQPHRLMSVNRTSVQECVYLLHKLTQLSAC